MAAADEFKIKITADADLKGAKATTQAFEDIEESAEDATKEIQEVTKATRKLEDAAEDAGEQLEGLGEAGESSEKGLKSTEDLVGALAMAMEGDLLGAASQAGGAVEELTEALEGGPWGIASAAIGLLGAAFLVFTADADVALDTVGQAGLDAGEEIEKGLGKATQAVDEFNTKLDKSIARMRAVRQAQDEIAGEKLAYDISLIDEEERNEKITPEEAMRKRAKLRIDDKVSRLDGSDQIAQQTKDEITGEMEKLEAAKADAAAELAKRQEAFEAAAQQAGKVGADGFATGTADDFISAEQAAQRNLEQAKDYTRIEGDMISRDDLVEREEMIAKAEAQLEAVEELALAYQNLKKAKAEAEDTSKAEEKFTDANEPKLLEADKTLKKNQWTRKTVTVQAQGEQEKIAEQERERISAAQVALLKQSVEQRKQGLQNEITAIEQGLSGKEEDTADFRKSVAEIAKKKKQLIDLETESTAINGEPTEEQRAAADLKKQAVDAAGEAQLEAASQRRMNREKPQQDALELSQGIARDVRGLKGPSPEVSARLQQAASALDDGATNAEIYKLNLVLEKLATSLEKRGKSDEAGGIKALQRQVDRLEGVVNLWKNSQGGSGS